MDPNPDTVTQQLPQTQQSTHPHPHPHTHTHTYKPKYCLLGDVGGTNMRFSLWLIEPPHNEPIQKTKKSKLLVKQNDNFEQAIRQFLADLPAEKYPEVAVIGVAGPVEDNKVSLSNVPKWGELDGEKLGASLKIKDFVFLNDFIANSYGLLLLPQDNFVSLNGLKLNPKHTRGVLGPGTGLGNSIIYSAPFRKRQRVYVLPSQNGHCDTPLLDETTPEYLKFLSQKLGVEYVGLEYSFCGPAIPYMYEFWASKFPAYEGANKKPTSEQIIEAYLANREADTLEKKTVDYFISLYCSAICNFIIGHMCTGGLVLVGSLTNAVLERLKQINITEKFGQRHPEVAKLLNKAPIVVSKEVDLGLRGAYVYARRIIADEQHD